MESTGGDSFVELVWIPLGAGRRFPAVRLSGAVYERLVALRQGRPPLHLVHAALVVEVDGARWTVEMAPAWGPGSQGPGVVVTGPVFLRALGRSRFFRYEVRRWRDGVIPDLDLAVATRRVTADRRQALAILSAVNDVPALVWGRGNDTAGDMWNSNSLAAFLVARVGLDAAAMALPAGLRAPGWAAGLVKARQWREALKVPNLRGPD